jgi:hypothetical protein
MHRRSLLQNETTVLAFNERKFAGYATQNRSHGLFSSDGEKGEAKVS